jgi:hypothetical protein
MSISYEQKNENILNRFENKEGKGSCRAYKLRLTDGCSMTLVSMQGETFNEILVSQKRKWGNRFESLTNV